MSARTPVNGSLLAAILAGGRSERFGSNKARAKLGSGTLIEAVAMEASVALRQSGVKAPLWAVAAPGQSYADLGLPTLCDGAKELGPLAGLCRALEEANSQGLEWVWLLPCDTLGFRGAWLHALLRAPSRHSTAVAFRGARWEPMFGLYSVALLPEARRRLETTERALWALLSENGAGAVPLPEGWQSLRRIDTQTALIEATQ